MLVGRQIVDRAKIQRIIFEFDYYEKAFHQFYDTYRVVPGNLDEKTCNKYTEFKTQLNCSFDHYHGQVIKNAPGKVIQTLLNWRSVAYPMSHLRVAKLIEGSTVREVIGVGENDMSKTNWYSNLMYFDVVQRDFSQASFDRNVFYNFFGFNFKGNSWEDIMYYFPGCTKMYGDKNELSNSNFKNLLRGKNTIGILNVADFLKEGTGTLHAGTYDGGNGNRTNGCNKNAQGSMSAKLTSELDSKIDDGRPGTGKLLGLKSGYAHRSGATEQDVTNNCYDQKPENVDKAIYNNSTDLKYGCNIIKVMEDLK